jgi:2-(1,2-epoxy-1,2-dihydrophenyl)acetyl-CoA isomerase
MNISATYRGDKMTYKTITFAVRDDIATLTFNRPDKLNALTPEMFTEMQAALDRIDTSPQGARCLLITGAGRGFCAGADLSALLPDPDTPPDLSEVIEKYFNPFVKRLIHLPLPVIAAVNGPAAGAGMSIALASDIIIAARSASFLQAFVNIGLIPDSGSTWLLPRLVGKARAYQLAMLGEKLSAEKAEEWGLITKCVDDADLMPEAMKIATKFAQGPTKALAFIRQALAAAEANSLSEQLDLEEKLQRKAGFSKDFMEGVAAFMAKRAAKFTGV